MITETPADLRAEIARHRVRLYWIAARINLHPARLGLVLNERAPLTPELASKIRRAIEDARGRAQ